MKCPNCSYEFTDYPVNCCKCNYYLVSTDNLNLIIDSCINAYSNVNIKPLEFPSSNSSIVFKNILSDQQNENSYSKYINHEITPEEFAIEYYKHNGYEAFFSENNYWLVLFLMIYFYQDFIDSYFPVEQAFLTAIHNEERLAAIESMDFNNLDNIPNLANHIIKTYFEHVSYDSEIIDSEEWGTYPEGLNKYFSIDELIVPILHLDKEQLKLIFKRMGDGFKYYTSGFPDLIVYNEKEFFFAEVKSKGDSSSFKQIQWHKFLSEVVGIDVVVFMIDKSDDQIIDIKKSYDVGLEDSQKRKRKFKEEKVEKIFIDWDDDNLKRHIFPVSKDKINKIIDMRRAYSMRYKKYVVNDYTRLSLEDFGDDDGWKRYVQARLANTNDFVYKKVRELYSSTSFGDYRPTQRQLERNKKAKSFEDKGKYSKAINLYMKNVVEKTGSPVTYKLLIYILNKFDRFHDVIKLMDIAIPIFVTLNDRNNSLRFFYQRFAAMNGNKSMPAIETISYGTSTSTKKTSDKQMDLSSYFN